MSAHSFEAVCTVLLFVVCLFKYSNYGGSHFANTAITNHTVPVEAHFEHWQVLQELREERHKVCSNLANIRGVCRIFGHVTVPSTNWIVHKQHIGYLHL